MAEKKTKKKLPLTIFEFVAYPITGLLGLWGLTYIILGVIAGFLSSKTGLAKANAKLAEGGLGFLGQGLIIMLVAVVATVIVLLIFAKNSDREFEKEQRRAAARANRHFGKVEDAIVEDAVEAE